MSQLTLLGPNDFRVDPTPRTIVPWREYEGVRLYHGDCVEVLRDFPPCSIDASVTDPPYGLGFMNKKWDTFKPAVAEAQARKRFQIGAGRFRNHENPNLRGRSAAPAISPSQIEYDRSVAGQRAFQAWCESWARELLRVLKPGAHVLVCGAPRSAHRMTCGLEDAGFEIRDGLAWLFGQGFPKSYNFDDGRGTALKPGHEPIVLARVPLDGTLEENVARWGVGSLDIDGCRIPVNGEDDRDPRDGIDGETGRWPANVALDAEAAALLDDQAGIRKSGANPTRRGSDKFRKVFGNFKGESCTPARGADIGGASRFYFVAKPSRAERDFGCDALPVRSAGECTDRKDGSAGLTPYAGAGRSGGGRNFHPTVKPVALMQWLVRLITPPGGTVVDPFLGSGTTGMACVLEERQFIGIEQEEDYLPLPDARISALLRELR